MISTILWTSLAKAVGLRLDEHGEGWGDGEEEGDEVGVDCGIDFICQILKISELELIHFENIIKCYS